LPVVFWVAGIPQLQTLSELRLNLHAPSGYVATFICRPPYVSPDTTGGGIVGVDAIKEHCTAAFR